MMPESYVCRCDSLYTGKNCLVRRSNQNSETNKAKEAAGYKNMRKSNRRWLGRRRRIRIMKVIGDTGSRGDKSASSGEAVRVGVLTAGSFTGDDAQQAATKAEELVNVTVTAPVLVGTTIPKGQTTTERVENKLGILSSAVPYRPLAPSTYR
ncbi:hypothetical protein GCK32_003081 [Trichostrongylus colubriformis]|uniref:EGF-like domain-containing protein n=1 Tax=Trichostrongylus colubriformis TaxID=6319 RepID=A0AAN8FMV4_TRICO